MKKAKIQPYRLRPQDPQSQHRTPEPDLEHHYMGEDPHRQASHHDSGKVPQKKLSFQITERASPQLSLPRSSQDIYRSLRVTDSEGTSIGLNGKIQTTNLGAKVNSNTRPKRK